MDGRTEESSESPVCVCVCFPSPDFKLIALLFFWISPELISPWDEWQESGESTIGAQTDLCSCLHWTHMNWREPPSRWTSALCVCVCVLKRRNSNGETPPHRTAPHWITKRKINFAQVCFRTVLKLKRRCRCGATWGSTKEALHDHRSRRSVLDVCFSCFLAGLTWTNCLIRWILPHHSLPVPVGFPHEGKSDDSEDLSHVTTLKCLKGLIYLFCIYCVCVYKGSSYYYFHCASFKASL